MQGKENYPHLFSPGKIGTLEVPNRIVMAPMATNYASETGGMTDNMIHYYELRARFGVGFIIVENSCVDYPLGRGGATHIRMDRDAFIPGISRLVESVHHYGAKIAIQINHTGPAAVPAKNEGLGPVGASAITYSPRLPIPRILELEEIDAIIEKFAQAALRARKAGFDAVELHGGHGYLMAHFMSSFTNKRTDEYGGDLQGRLRFPIRVIHRCRELVGQDYPIMMRMSGDEFLEGGRDLEGSKEVARIFAEEGIDAVHVTAGTHAALHPSGTYTADTIAYEQGWRVYLAEGIKASVDIPVIAVGVIREPAFAEEVLAKERADFVAVGRGLIVDPEWSLKAREGRAREIRRCISCNEGCLRRRAFMDLPMRCALNAEVGRSPKYLARPITGAPKRVLVVGGGPGGMEAARVLKLRGHDVSLWEKADVLGGQLLLAGIPWFKKKLLWFVKYLRDELMRLEVACEFNHEATADRVLEFDPDELILATGSISALPPIPGIRSRHVRSLEDVLVEDYRGNRSRVVVMGGGVKGAELALFLAERGERVTVIEMLSDVALELEPISRQDLIARLDEKGVVTLNDTEILSIDAEGVRVQENKDEERLIEADLAIPCLGYRPVNDLGAALAGKLCGIHAIGDCRKPRMIIHAVTEAYEIASKI